MVKGKKKKMKTVIATCLLLVLLLSVTGVLSVEWKHSAVLDNNFLVLWTPGERDVMFEIQVKTLGYVGLGFTRDDGTVGADMVIGWVDNNGQLHLQVSVLKSVTLFPLRSSSDTARGFLPVHRLPASLMLLMLDENLYTYIRCLKLARENVIFTSNRSILFHFSFFSNIFTVNLAKVIS